MNFLLMEEKKQELNQLKNPKAFINFSQTFDDTYENLEDHNPTMKRKVLIVLGDMIANMNTHKKLNSIVNELFMT